MLFRSKKNISSYINGFENQLLFIDHMFENIISVLKELSSSYDKFRFVLRSPSLSYPISIPVLPVKSNNLVNMIHFELCRVLQSYQGFQLNNMQLNVLHLSGPRHTYDTSDKYMV